MKFSSISAIIFSSACLISCNKSDFKETKVAVTVPSMSSSPGPAPEMPATGSSQELPPGHPPINGQSKPSEMPAQKVENIVKAEGGVTVEECFKNKATLNGKNVTLRAKVVKFNSGILKRNWLHVSDGTGAKGQNDLVVTTLDNANINDTVIVKGVLHYDKDIGSGYFFPAIIEDAKIKIEK